MDGHTLSLDLRLLSVELFIYLFLSPKDFIIPIVKDSHGDNGDLNNYRGITIAPIMSKIFEHTLRRVFLPSFSTSYYTGHGRNVYCSFLDASKAFDRLVHAGLFLKTT